MPHTILAQWNHRPGFLPGRGGPRERPVPHSGRKFDTLPRIVGSFTDDQIRAAVESGRLSDPEAAHYLFFQIKERRDLITHYYSHRTTGLSGFRIETQGDGARIRFEDVCMRTTGTTSDIQYELQADGQAVASGSATDSSLSLDRDTLAKIAAAAKPARLTLRRRGESFVSEVFIVYEDGRARITGIRHN